MYLRACGLLLSFVVSNPDRPILSNISLTGLRACGIHLPEGFALIEAGTFCGKPATAHIFLNPANITKLLSVGSTVNHGQAPDFVPVAAQRNV
jgi:hypothetical protein